MKVKCIMVLINIAIVMVSLCFPQRAMSDGTNNTANLILTIRLKAVTPEDQQRKIAAIHAAELCVTQDVALIEALLDNLQYPDPRFRSAISPNLDQVFPAQGVLRKLGEQKVAPVILNRLATRQSPEGINREALFLVDLQGNRASLTIQSAVKDAESRLDRLRKAEEWIQKAIGTDTSHSRSSNQVGAVIGNLGASDLVPQSEVPK